MRNIRPWQVFSRWWFPGAITLFGLVLILIGAWVSEPYWAGVLANAGTTVLLAAALVLLERQITKVVDKGRSEAVIEATAAATQAAGGIVEDRLSSLSKRLDDLDGRVEGLTTKRSDEARHAAAEVAAIISYETVRSAMMQATDLGAIATGIYKKSGQIIVAAGDGVDAARFQVSWRPFFESKEVTRPEHIELAFVQPNSVAPLDNVIWDKDDKIEVVFDEVIKSMQRGGYGADTKSVSAEKLFTNLSVALSAAIRAREENTWLGNQPLLEWLWNGWAITEAGLVVENQVGVLVEGSQFPRVKGDRTPLPRKAPTWTDDESWLTSFNLVRAHFSFRSN